MMIALAWMTPKGLALTVNRADNVEDGQYPKSVFHPDGWVQTLEEVEDALSMDGWVPDRGSSTYRWRDGNDFVGGSSWESYVVDVRRKT